MKKIVLVGINQGVFNCVPIYLLKAYSVKFDKILKNFKFILFEINKNELVHEEFVKKITSLNPDVVGFSTYLWNVEEVVSLARDIKAKIPKTKIILGGPEIHERYDLDFVDHIFLGEGEVILSDFLLSYLENKNIPKIISGFTRKVASLDDIPSPILNGMTKKFDSKMFTLEVSRGCPFDCSYCSESKKRNRISTHSVNRIVEEVKKLKSKKVKKVYLLSPNFNYDREYAIELCQKLAKINNKNEMMFSVEIKVDMMDEALMDEMMAANISMVQMGIQSFDEKTLKNCHRPQNNALLKKKIQLLKNKGFTVICDLIIGLPGDDYTSFKKSLGLAISLKPNKINAFVLKLLPHTSMRKDIQKFKIIFDQTPPYEIRSNYSFSKEDLLKSKLLIEKINKYQDRNRQSRLNSNPT